MDKRKRRITFNSPFVLAFSGLCFIATLLGVITGGSISSLLFMTYHSSWVNPLTYLRLFTHVLGHSGWSHFIGNMSYILLIGPLLEEKYGTARLVEVTLVTALVTSLVSTFFFPATALLGASGVVFAFILLSSFTSFKEGEIPLTFILVAVIFLGQEIYNGIFLMDNVSQLAHIVGGIVGAGFGYLLGMSSKKSY